MPQAFYDAVRAALGPQIHAELPQSQIEVATVPHVNAADARSELRMLRQTLSRIAAEHGLALLAAGTHPTAAWAGQRHSGSERHALLMQDLQMLARRNRRRTPPRGCLPELRRCHDIIGAGTSADVQLAVYEAHESKGNPKQALRAVTDWIAVATLQ